MEFNHRLNHGHECGCGGIQFMKSALWEFDNRLKKGVWEVRDFFLVDDTGGSGTSGRKRYGISRESCTFYSTYGLGTGN